MEAHQVAIMFSHRGGKVVVPQLAGNAAQSVESVQVAANESLETLAVGELDIEFAAVTFHQAKGVELARRAGVVQRPEVAPVDVETLAGSGLHTHVRTPSRGALAQSPQIVLHDGHAAVEALSPQPLLDQDNAERGVLLEQFRDRRLERIQFAGPIAVHS